MSIRWHAIILAWIISFWGGFAYGEVKPYEIQMPIQCGDTDNLIKGLNERYQEEIVMIAPSTNPAGHELYHSLWINMSSRTWSFIVVNKDAGVTCMLASGEGVNMFFPGSGI